MVEAVAMNVQSRVVLLLSAMLAGCSAAGPDASDPRAARCADLTNQINAWLDDHRSCNVDGDCTGEAAYGPLYGTGTPPTAPTSCWPPEVLSKDSASGYLSLLQQLDNAKCDGLTQVCTGYFPTPTCRDHVCTDH
jgi:hypothetical protein